MNDRIQSQPPRPLPDSAQDEYYAVNLRKPPSAMPGWVWVLIALPVLGIGVLFCGGLAAGFLLNLRAGGSSPPPAVGPVVPAPELPADPLPDGR